MQSRKGYANSIAWTSLHAAHINNAAPTPGVQVSHRRSNRQKCSVQRHCEHAIRVR